MAAASIGSTDFKWKGWQPEVDDAQIFTPNYLVTMEANTSQQSVKSKFADLPSSGIWEKRTEGDDALLGGLE